MNAARVNAAARVVQAALEQGKRTSAGLAIALESAGLLNAPEVTELLALSEQQIEVLAAAGHRVANDANHEHQCMCDAWPERCVSTGNYYMGAWDVSGLEDALPAVLALWEQMRGGEILRLQARVDELEAERHVTNEALDDAVQELRARETSAAGRSADRLSRLFAPVAALREGRGAARQAGFLRGLGAAGGSLVEDPHDGPLAHRYLVGRDLPESGGA